MTVPSAEPIAVCHTAVVSPLEVVARGLVSMLDRHRDRVALGSAERADVVVLDTWALHRGMDPLDRLVDAGRRVLVIGHELRPDLSARALAHGARAAVPLAVEDDDLVAAVRATCGCHDDALDLPAVAEAPGPRPGHEVGVTPREADVLALIAQGLSNQEIAQRLYLSINSVKTHIRTAYRRLGVTSRSQAVLWCVQHGFDPGDPSRAARW